MPLDPYVSEQKCKGCGKNLQQNGPFAHRKKEGEPSYKGPSIAYLFCLTEGCPENGKTIEVEV